MSKHFYIFILAVSLTSCSSLEKKSEQLEVGASRLDVARVMGSAPYKFTHENVDAWRYAVVAGFGYCDYREFYIYRDVLIYKNEYHRASIAGCTAGLKDIDWVPVFAAVEDHDNMYPTINQQPSQGNIVDQLKELNQMRESGALTEQEYIKAKRSVLND